MQNGIQEVSGSIPLISTKDRDKFSVFFFFAGKTQREPLTSCDLNCQRKPPIWLGTARTSALKYGKAPESFDSGAFASNQFASSYMASARILALSTRREISINSSGLCSRTSSPGKMGPKARVFGIILA